MNNVITTVLLITVGVDLNYLPISKSRLIFIVSEFLTGGII